MVIKNQLNRKKVSTEEIQKRFSKAKMKREIVMTEDTTILKVSPKIKKINEPKQYKCTVVDKYQFRGNPKNIYSATLKYSTSQQKGYSVLSKGQQVTVEDFGSDQPLRVTTMDGRVGITHADCINPLCF